MAAAFVLICGVNHVTAALTVLWGGWTHYVHVVACSFMYVASAAPAFGVLKHAPRIMAFATLMMVTPGAADEGIEPGSHPASA